MYALEKFKKGDLELAESAKNGEERAHNLPFSNSKLLDSDLLQVHTKKRLGAGNFGIVCEGEYEGRLVAVKTLKDAIDFETLQAFFKELKIMDYVGKHEHIVELIGAEVSGILSGKVRAVLEYCPHGCLEEYLKKQRKLVFSHCAIQINSNNIYSAEFVNSETSATEGHEPFENFEPTLQLLCHWSYQISRAMSFLASKGVVHGDLATRNVLVFNNYMLKLADFGMSRNLYSSAAYFQCNNKRPLPWRWLSPEVLEDRQFSVKSDVWSYGVTLWEIFELAKIPYPNLAWDSEFVKDLKNGSLRLSKPELMPQQVYNVVVLRCFETNFENRVDFASIEEYWNQYFEPEVGPETYIGRGLSEDLKDQCQTIQRMSKVRFKKEMRIDYYRTPIEALYDKLGSHPTQGLSNKQVDRNKTKFGGNLMSPLKQQPIWLNFIKTLIGGFQLLLWTSSISIFAAYIVHCLHLGVPPDNSLHLYLSGAFAFSATVLGCFTFCQEYFGGSIWKSSSKSSLSSSNYCIRNGHLQSIDASELVVGDIVKLKSGDRIPADVRLIEACGFKVDNSSVTGQLDPQLLIPESTYKNALGDRYLAFASTNVLEGTAKGIVVAVGDNTCIGRVVGSTSDLNSRDTPLAKNALRFIILILAVAVFVGVAFFVAVLMAGFELLNSCLFSIGIIVATVPVGVPVSFPAILALTAKRLARKGCAVKTLYAAETLGSTTVICFDKTGTLTQNRMTVSNLWFGNKIHEVAAGTQFDDGDAGLRVLARAASLCSRATFSTSADQQDIPIQERQVHGDASEAAILRFFEDIVGDTVQYRAEMTKVFEIPFDSTNKWQLSIHEAMVDGRRKNLLVMKGAPEKIIDYCCRIVIGHKEYELNDWWEDALKATCEKLGGMGERMLGFCDLVLPEEDYPIGFEFTEENTEYLKLGLRFVGLVSMGDPLRPGARETVEACRSAGIKVVMMTGDHASTSAVVAKNVGIIGLENETLEERANRLNMDTFEVDGSDIETIVVTGEDFAKFSGDHLEKVLRNHSEIVFARVSSQQKLLIVEGFQRLNEVVAMAGDGVNDGPALKKADVGIAMGIAGSDVAKQTADMILLNDDLRAILSGIEQGRSMFEKLVKCVRHLLASSVALLVPFFVFILLRIPLPLDMIPLLLLSLGTGIAPTLSLLFESTAEDLMKRPPRNSIKSNLIFDSKIPYSYGRFGILESAAGIFAYFMEMSRRSLAPKHLMGLATMWYQWDDPGFHVVNWDGRWILGYELKWLEFRCWSSYFCAVVLCQWVTFLVSMAVRASFIEKLRKNWIVFSGIFFEAAIAFVFVFTYTLGNSHPNQLGAVSCTYFFLWLVGVPLCFVGILYDVIRKLVEQKCSKK